MDRSLFYTWINHYVLLIVKKSLCSVKNGQDIRDKLINKNGRKRLYDCTSTDLYVYLIVDFVQFLWYFFYIIC